MAFRNCLSCYVCERLFAPQQMARIDRDEHDAVRELAIRRRDAFNLAGLIVTVQARLCVNCNQSILNEILLMERDPACLRLNVLTQTANHSCVICNGIRDIHRLSVECRINVFVSLNIYIPEDVRSCQHHLDDRGLLFVNTPYIIPGQQLHLFLRGLRSVAMNSTRFDNEHSFTDEEFHSISPITKEQFLELLTFCDPVPCQELLKENNNLKDTIASNLSRFNSSSPTKVNRSSDSSQAVSKLNLKSRRVSDDIPIQEGNNSPEIILTGDPQTPTKSKKIPAENEITVEFDSDSDQSWLEHSGPSKSASISSEHQLQKSPLIGNQKRTKLKKSQSPRMDLTPQIVSPSSAKEDSKKVKNEPDTESQRSVYKDVKPLDTTKTFFTSLKEKEDQTFVSPQPKPRSKLGITKLYNVNTNLLNNGNKLKQTKLVFTAEEEKTDISSANVSNQSEIDTCDSIFNLTILNDAVVENMNTDIEDPFPSRNSSSNTEKITDSFEKPLVTEEDDIIEIYPSPLNSCIKRSKNQKLKKQDDISKKSSKVSKSPKRDNSVPSKVFTLKTDDIFFAPQGCSTQISLSKNADKCDMRSIQDLCTDSDTNFNFDEKNTSKKQSPEHTSKAILADVSNTLSPQKSKSDKREEHLSQESRAPVTETSMEDETFFSPGEHRNDTGCEEIPRTATSEQKNATSVKAKRVLMSSFDQVPASKKRNPEYAYAVQSVKRKCERMELDGWSCWSCKQYYENMKLPEAELREYMKKCSRHKAKHDPEYHTPPGFWNPVFSDTIAPSLPGLHN